MLCPCGCGREFEPMKIGAHVKRFATAACKRKIETAARRWAMKAFDDGLLTPDALKPFLASRATAIRAEDHSGVSE